MILESDPDLEEYIGIFPDGISRVSEYVHLLKGKKTKENVSCGKVMEVILNISNELLENSIRI